MAQLNLNEGHLLRNEKYSDCNKRAGFFGEYASLLLGGTTLLYFGC